MFYISFFFNERFAHSLFLVSDVSELLRPLTKNERMSQLPRFIEQITHSLIFGQKTSDSPRKPMSEFPALNRYHGYSN